MTKRKTQRNFETDKETEQKLNVLRNYHNQSFNRLYKIIVDNAFMAMEEKKNEGLAEKLDTQYIKTDHQIQQLTLMFGAYKTELEKLKTDNDGLKEKLSEVEEHSKKTEEENKNNYKRIIELRSTKMDKLFGK